MKILVTGGAGFIGSAVRRRIIEHTLHAVVNVDKLTYAANLDSLASVAGDARYCVYIQVVERLCDTLGRPKPRRDGASYRDQIAFVIDRPGHDYRYAINRPKVEWEFGWRAQESFETGIDRTVACYLENQWWWQLLADSGSATWRLGPTSATAEASQGAAV